MEEYLMSQDAKGNIILRELPKEGKIIHPSVFKPRLRLGGGEFEQNGHKVKWVRYAEENNIFTVIRAEYIKWSIPLRYVDTDQWILDGSQPNRNCFIKDVVLVTQQGAHKIEAYMFHGNMKAPSLNNVHADSRLCLTGWNKYPDCQMLTAKTILTHIEESPGNDHTMVTDAKDPFPIFMEKGMAVLNPRLGTVKINPYAVERSKYE